MLWKRESLNRRSVSLFCFHTSPSTICATLSAPECLKLSQTTKSFNRSWGTQKYPQPWIFIHMSHKKKWRNPFKELDSPCHFLSKKNGLVIAKITGPFSFIFGLFLCHSEKVWSKCGQTAIFRNEPNPETLENTGLFSQHITRGASWWGTK